MHKCSNFSTSSAALVFFWVFLMFIFVRERERERVHMHAHREGAEKEGEREFQAGSVLSAQSLTQGWNSQTMRSWPELKSRVECLTNWATQVPQTLYFSLLKYPFGSPYIFYFFAEMVYLSVCFKSIYSSFLQIISELTPVHCVFLFIKISLGFLSFYSFPK